jgi:hypothetical protein
MFKFKYILAATACMLISLYAGAQEAKTAFGETMRSNGRIYVVIAVILTILAGLFLYLVRLEKKLSKLEKEK